MMNIIQKRNSTYILSLVLVFTSIVFLSLWGLRLGIDFQGGTLMEIVLTNQEQELSKEELIRVLEEKKLEDVSVQPTENGFLVRFLASNESINDQAREAIEGLEQDTDIVRTDFFGASVSKDLTRKAIEAVIVAAIGIALYIAYTFRKVSRPIDSWQYGIGALIALFHDVIITLGVFSFLGQFYGVEVGIPFVAAMLTVLGYSVNDTIVVYDRIRENLMRYGAREGFENIVNRSINETLARSFNTSFTVILVLGSILLFGGATIQAFSLALLVGVIAGTYSSIFVASALLVSSFTFWRKAYKS